MCVRRGEVESLKSLIEALFQMYFGYGRGTDMESSVTETKAVLWDRLDALIEESS